MVEIILKDGSKRTYNNYNEMFEDSVAMANWIPPVSTNRNIEVEIAKDLAEDIFPANVVVSKGWEDLL